MDFFIMGGTGEEGVAAQRSGVDAAEVAGVVRLVHEGVDDALPTLRVGGGVEAAD
jgi:hypothetical protein